MSLSLIGKTSALGPELASAGWFGRGEDIADSHWKVFSTRARARECPLVRERRGRRRLTSERLRHSGRDSRAPVGSREVRMSPSPIGKKIQRSGRGLQAPVGLAKARTSPSPIGINLSLGMGLVNSTWFRRGEDVAISHRKNFGARDKAHERQLVWERLECRRLPLEKLRCSGRGSRAPVGLREARTSLFPIRKTLVLETGLTNTG